MTYPSSPADEHRPTLADVAGLQSPPAHELCPAVHEQRPGVWRRCSLRKHTGEHQPWPWAYPTEKDARRNP